MCALQEIKFQRPVECLKVVVRGAVKRSGTMSNRKYVAKETSGAVILKKLAPGVFRLPAYPGS